MIETKEQYEEIMRHTPFYEGGETGAVRETIEALREVAKALDAGHVSDIVEALDMLMGFNDGGYDPNLYAALARYKEARAALPDWLKEDG